jgi:hypothetical protein
MICSCRGFKAGSDNVIRSRRPEVRETDSLWNHRERDEPEILEKFQKALI